MGACEGTAAAPSRRESRRPYLAFAAAFTLTTTLVASFSSPASGDLAPETPPEPCASDAPRALCTWLRAFSSAPTLEALAARVGPAGVEVQGTRYADGAALRAAVPEAGTHAERAALARWLAVESLSSTVTRGACTACPPGAIELVGRHGWYGSGSVRAVFAGPGESAAILRWIGVAPAL